MSRWLITAKDNRLFKLYDYLKEKKITKENPNFYTAINALIEGDDYWGGFFANRLIDDKIITKDDGPVYDRCLNLASNNLLKTLLGDKWEQYNK